MVSCENCELCTIVQHCTYEGVEWEEGFCGSIKRREDYLPDERECKYGEDGRPELITEMMR